MPTYTSTKREEDDRAERACADAFVEQERRRTGKRYSILRPPSKELGIEVGSWDFIVREVESDYWIGLEVKSLVDSEFSRSVWDGRRFCERIEKGLNAAVRGEFLVFGMPEPDLARLSHQTRNELLVAAIKVCDSVLPKMQVDEIVDLGPAILEHSALWPKESPQGARTADGRFEVKEPAKGLHVVKASNEGMSFSSETGFRTGYEPGRVSQQALSQVLSHGPDAGPKWAVQLGAARANGARETVLLFEGRVQLEPATVRDALADLEAKWLSAVDRAYVVRSGSSRIEQCWP